MWSNAGSSALNCFKVEHSRLTSMSISIYCTVFITIKLRERMVNLEQCWMHDVLSGKKFLAIIYKWTLCNLHASKLSRCHWTICFRDVELFHFQYACQITTICNFCHFNLNEFSFILATSIKKKAENFVGEYSFSLLNNKFKKCLFTAWWKMRSLLKVAVLQ